MKRRFALAALTATLAAACATGLAATAAWLISRAAEHPPVLHLMVAVVAVRAFGLGRAVLRYAERLIGHDAALHHLATLRVDFYQRLRRATNLPYRLGDLASRMVADIDAQADTWLRVTLPYAAAATVGAAAVMGIAMVLPAAALILAATLIVVALLAPWLSIRHAKAAQTHIAPASAQITTDVLTTVHNANEIIAFDLAPQTLAAITNRDQHLLGLQRRAAVGRSAATGLAVACAGVAVVSGTALAAAAAARGELDPVLVAVVVVTCLAVHELFAALVPAAADLPRIRAARARVTDIQPAPARPVTATLTNRYDIEVRDFSARGCRLPDMTIPEKTVHVLTGPSGSGKSTLAAAMVRLVTPDTGTIHLGGVDITDVDEDELRRVIGWCAQDAHIFDTTIAANLRLARPDASDERLYEAVATAGLGEWIRALPEGLDTHVGEYGRSLSGGQRQRLALARVLLADFPVVILDEPTEHVDADAARGILDDVLAVLAGRTVLLITHQSVPEAIAVTYMDEGPH